MTVALCPLVGEEQQLKLGGIHEVQAAEIDDDALGAFGLGDVELVLQRPRRGQVELPNRVMRTAPSLSRWRPMASSCGGGLVGEALTRLPA